MWFQNFYILIPALFVTQCTIGLGSIFVVVSWIQVIFERVTKARWENPAALYALTIAVFLDVAASHSLHAPRGDLLYSESDYLCLLFMIASFAFVLLSMFLVRKASGPGTRTVRIGSGVLRVIAALGFVGFVFHRIQRLLHELQGADAIGQEVHLRLRLSDAHARSQAAKQTAELVFAVAKPILVAVNQRFEAER